MKTALVIGCAANVWNDVARAKQLTTFDAIYCVKLAGVHYPGAFQTWITLHPEYMDDYEAQRHQLGYPNGYEIVAPLVSEVGMHGKKGHIARRVTYRWPGMTSSASSGIYGAKIALDDGYERVVLAGVPMDQDAGHFLPEAKRTNGKLRGSVWSEHGSFMPGFEKSVRFLQGKVKSMSGHTQKVLGAPSAEWFL